MRRRPPGTTRTDTLFPYTTLCRSARLHQVHQRHGRRGEDLPVAAHAGGEGPSAGPDADLCAVRPDRALAEGGDAGAGARAPAEPGGAREARRHLGVHHVLLLLDSLPELLVDPRPLPRPRTPAEPLPLETGSAND